MEILAQHDHWGAQYLESLKKSHEEYTAPFTELLSVDLKRTREQTLNVTKEMRSANKSIAKEILQFLRDYWSTKALSGPEIPESPDAGGESPAKQSPAASPLDQFAVLAQRFVALHYSSFILYAVRQVQNLLLFLSSGFVLLMISLNCYSLQAPQFVDRLLVTLFLIIGAVTVTCLVGIERDPIVSRISGSDPGKLNTGFYLKIAAYGALPALSLLASIFPSISNFLLSWVEPTLEAFK
ncbi:MAG TPA: hypothetical protein VN841_05120 [Bryobacteraceae bacterium]|nr:hypothetical protein [Bryobacteraceae bacterium]